MSDNFDASAARARHGQVIAAMQVIRDHLTTGINAHYDHPPQTREDDRAQTVDFRQYLNAAADRIHTLLNSGLL